MASDDPYADQAPCGQPAGDIQRTNPNAWRVKRPYVGHIDVRAAIIHDPQPIHFDPEDCEATTDVARGGGER